MSISNPTAYQKTGYASDLAKLGLVLVIFFYAFLGQRPLGNPDEGRYAEIPREMIASGDYITPRLDGVKYFEKPPLVYWLTAGSLKVFGQTEFGARFWVAGFGVLGALLTYAAGRALFDRVTGWAAAIVLSTSLLYCALARVLLLDLVVSVFIAAALFAFILGIRSVAGPRRRWLFWAFYAAMALAALTKGLIGIALPCAVAGIWVLACNRWSRLRPFYPFSGTVIFAVIAVPWHVLAARANADFLYFYFVHEHFLRYTTQIHDRGGAWWFFIPIVLGGFFPWVFFLFPALKLSRHCAPAAEKEKSPTLEAEPDVLWFLYLWIGFIFLFFSFSGSKLAPYILPVFPALAVLVGRYLAGLWIDDARIAASRFWIYSCGVFCVIAAIAIPLIKVARDASVRAEIRPWQWGIAFTLGVGGLLIVACNFRSRQRSALVLIASTTAVVALAFGPVFKQVDRRSTQPLALALKGQIALADKVYSFHNYHQDFPFYLGRTIDVVDYQGELAFGIAAEPDRTATRFIDTERFVAQWNSPDRSFAVAHRADAAPLFKRTDFPHVIVAEFRDFVLFSNR